MGDDRNEQIRQTIEAWFVGTFHNIYPPVETEQLNRFRAAKDALIADLTTTQPTAASKEE